MLDRLRLQVLDVLYTVVVCYGSAIDALALCWLSLARPDVESLILYLLYILKEVGRLLALVERLSDRLKCPVGQYRLDRLIVVVELLFKVVLVCIRNVLEL